MGLKDILVHVDCSKANAARVQAAIELAQRHEAHVTGLYVIPWVNMPAYAEFQVGPEVIQAQEEAARIAAEEEKKRFWHILLEQMSLK